MTTGFRGERVGIDIIGPLPISDDGHEYILVMIDYFTKWTEAIPVLRQDAASVANAVNRTWISRCGSPLSFHSDCGSNFEPQLVWEVCEMLEHFNQHTAGTAFQIGDLAMHYYPIPTRATSVKLHRHWRGPFAVLNVLAATSFLLRDAICAE
ncbi:unnamed protein product [Schistocephalus solidus]|uniref:Integrase catalytic domain-containing protein n=1 Tax=Schistocephalus solidus TaxID=70667 RepID=A0A183SFT2_SCHSO|nr:unnamed protein product [Schistocephalus solidus]